MHDAEIQARLKYGEILDKNLSLQRKVKNLEGEVTKLKKELRDAHERKAPDYYSSVKNMLYEIPQENLNYCLTNFREILPPEVFLKWATFFAKHVKVIYENRTERGGASVSISFEGTFKEELVLASACNPDFLMDPRSYLLKYIEKHIKEQNGKKD